MRQRRRVRRQPRADDVERGVGRAAARGLTADAVDDDEDAAVRVDVETILVDVALGADVGDARGAELRAAFVTRGPSHTAQPSATDERDQRRQQSEPRPEQQRH